MIAQLCDVADTALGYLLIELGKGHTASGNTIATSLTRPLIGCLAAQIALDRRGRTRLPAGQN